jgi:hypothetical protein
MPYAHAIQGLFDACILWVVIPVVSLIVVIKLVIPGIKWLNDYNDKCELENLSGIVQKLSEKVKKNFYINFLIDPLQCDDISSAVIGLADRLAEINVFVNFLDPRMVWELRKIDTPFVLPEKYFSPNKTACLLIEGSIEKESRYEADLHVYKNSDIEEIKKSKFEEFLIPLLLLRPYGNYSNSLLAQ